MSAGLLKMLSLSREDVGELRTKLIEVQVENSKLLEGIRYWSYCMSEGMRATAPEKCEELFDFLIQCKIAPYYMSEKDK